MNMYVIKGEKFGVQETWVLFPMWISHITPVCVSVWAEQSHISKTGITWVGTHEAQSQGWAP